MTENLAEVAAIANNPAPATFDNTIVALERSGQLLGRVSRISAISTAVTPTPTLQAVEKAMAPKLAAHRDAILLNAPLYARVASLYAARTGLGLDPESARLLDETHKSFVRAGAKLSEADKTKLKVLNAAIATAETAFSQNVLKERTASAVYFSDRAALARSLRRRDHRRRRGRQSRRSRRPVRHRARQHHRPAPAHHPHQPRHA